MKNILTGDDAIDSYEEIQGSYSSENITPRCGYFVSDDYEGTQHYDSGTIVAFDSTDGVPYEEVFSTINEALQWIEM